MATPKNLAPLLGKWHHTVPFDTDDYLSEYSISYDAETIVVTAKDLQDGELFVISDISWDGTVLKFHSLMPSTGREGINEFRSLGEDSVECKFTFTVIEELRRKRT